MSAAVPCPHPEEFSALLDRQLAPEEIPTLERHVGECENCRKLFLRLAAADRMLGLTLGRIDLVGECLGVKAGKDDSPSDKMREDLEAFGRAERAACMREQEERAAKRRRRRKVLFFLFLLLLIGGFAGALQPTPVSDLGGARRESAYVIGPGEVVLYRGARVALSEGSRARFWCAFRWEKPRAALKAGKLTVLKGDLVLAAGGELHQMKAGQVAVLSPDGKLRFEEVPGAPKTGPSKTPEPESPVSG